MKNNNRKFSQVGKFIVLFLFLGGIIASCSKDSDNPEEDLVNRADFEQNYFNISDGDFNGRPMPASNSQSLEILSISGNSTVLAGGSNLIHLTGSENATQVVVGVKDQKGYFTVPLVADRDGANRGTMAMTDLRLLIGQGVTGTFTISFSVSDGLGNFSVYEYLVVNLMDAGTGILQVSLSWDQLNDVDLHLIDPNGEEIYYGNPTSATGGQLDVDSNAACYIDEINNENIYYDDSPDVTIPFGEYEVLIDLWSNCDIVPSTNYTVVVYYGGELIATTVGVNPHNGVLAPDTTEMVSIMKFNIDSAPAPRSSGTTSVQSSLKKGYKFDFDKSNKVFKDFSPKK